MTDNLEECGASKPQRPECATSGMIRRGVACGHVIIGDRTCGYKGVCPHQRHAAAPALQEDTGMSKPTERAAFEAWQASKGWKRPDDPGEWEAWQACAERFGQAEPVAANPGVPHLIKAYAAPQPDRVAELERANECEKLEGLRIYFGAERTPAYGDCLGLAKKLERERDALAEQVERLRKTEQFLRSERPIARRCTELEEQAETLIYALRKAEEWLSGWGSAEPYLSIIRAALAARADVSKTEGGAAR